MRLVTLEFGNEFRPGVVVGDEILDLRGCDAIVRAARLVPRDIKGILGAGPAALDLLRSIVDRVVTNKDQLRERRALVKITGAKLAAPIPNPGMILSIGANYHEHLKEMNVPAPKTPLSFFKSVASIIGTGEPIILPASNPDMVDWEGEFSVVIGRPCHRVRASEALHYIAGYTVVNDVSARDWVAPAFAAKGMMETIVAWEHNILGKFFPTFCPMGPAIVTSDEIRNPHDLHLETRLNGKVVQSTNTSDLVFNVTQIIEYYSQFLHFRPGDIITTGSPSGVGYSRNPKLFMKPGDTIEVEVQGIGILKNPVAAMGKA